jgi:hypothetical protein
MAARFAPFYLVLLTVATFHSPLDARPLGEMGFRLGTKRLSAPPEGDHTCFVRADGNVLCWGNNAAGQIGDGTRGNVRDVPTPAAGVTTAVSVAAGRDHTCALLSNGAVRCWGSNSAGQLGLGSGVTEALSPTVVPNLNRVVSLAAGTEHTCAPSRTEPHAAGGATRSGRSATAPAWDHGSPRPPSLRSPTP